MSLKGVGVGGGAVSNNSSIFVPLILLEQVFFIMQRNVNVHGIDEKLNDCTFRCMCLCVYVSVCVPGSRTLS